MISSRDIQKLKYHPRDFAMMMDTEDLENVIIAFVQEKSLRENNRSRPET